MEMTISNMTTILSEWIPIIDEFEEKDFKYVWGNLGKVFIENGWYEYDGVTFIHEHASELGENGIKADQWLIAHDYVLSGKIHKTNGQVNNRLMNLKEKPLTLEMKEYITDLHKRGLSIPEIQACFYGHFNFDADEQKLVDCLYRHADRNMKHYQ